MSEYQDTSRRAKKVNKFPYQENIAAMGGKVPPQALDLEEAVLGALMLEKDALNEVIELLHPECFYKDAHYRIFNAIRNLFGKSEPVDILTVTNELKSTAELELAGGAFYVSQLSNRVASAANIKRHAHIILEKHIQRELIRVSTEIVTDAYEDTTDVLGLLDKAEQNLFEIAEKNLKRNFSDMQDYIKLAIAGIEKARTQGDGITGVQSGFTHLDRVTSGWQKSDLIIVAARPGMGKTAFTLTLARNAAVQFKRPVAFFSLEMGAVQLVNRLISGETELPAEKLRKGQLEEYEWAQLNSKIRTLTDAPIYIDDTPSLSIFELRAKCRRLKAQKDIELIIVDYLQLMTTGGDNKSGNREQEISTISRSLKSIAKELNVPVIALSQLSRAVESRGGDKRPQLSDLRESGAIEQDADMVMFIYRPDYYNITETTDGEHRDLRGVAEIIIAKHRNGSLENVNLRFTDKLAKFSDLLSDDLITEAYDDAQYGSGNLIKSSRMNMDNDENSPF